ncbi:hypothetical protein FACS1894216_01140 [Synergistales bacterium]|nr:hypothetical protein FACS1894216_01140 [Synergistales bacterium]
MSTTEVQIAQLANRIKEALRKLGNQRVAVGVPEGSAARNDPSSNNAYLAAIHENGSAARGIPARPFLVPGIHKAQGKIVRILETACANAVRNASFNPQAALDAVGLAAQSSVRKMFTDNDWAPNKPATQRAKNVKRGKPPDSDVTPLIDTGALRGSIQYVINPASEVNE